MSRTHTALRGEWDCAGGGNPCFGHALRPLGLEIRPNRGHFRDLRMDIALG